MAETTAIYHQQNLIKRTHQSIRKHLRKIQQIIRNQPHNRKHRSEDANKTGMLPYPTKSPTNTIPPTERPVNELDRLIKSGHLERLETIKEDCFVSPVVITVKKDKTVKIALEARKLNECCVKKRPHMPNMEELLNKISAELSRNDHDPNWISVVDLDYGYGQTKLAPETSKHCNFAMTGENINGYYRFLKGFYCPADIPTIL